MTQHESMRDHLPRMDAEAYRILFEKSPDGLLLVSDDSFVDCNEAAVRLLGYRDKAALLSRRPADLSPPQQPDGRESLEKSLEMMAITRASGSHRFDWVHSDVNGEAVWLEVSLTQVPVDGHEGIHVVWRPIGERVRMERELRQLARAFEISQGIMITDPNGVIERVNPAFTAITGYSADEAVGRVPRELLNSGAQDEAFYHQLFDQLLLQGHWDGELCNRHRDGHTFPVWESISTVRGAGGELENFVSVFRDISEQKALQAELELAANHDGLTGLYNRSRFDRILRDELTRQQRYGPSPSLVMFDVDHFKAVNDTHGHDVGDRVLVELTRRVDDCVRASDTLGRWGGEEFLILLPETAGDAAAAMAERIRARVESEPFPEVGTVTVSLGVATAGLRPTADELVKRADDALYQAKREGRNRVCVAP